MKTALAHLAPTYHISGRKSLKKILYYPSHTFVTEVEMPDYFIKNLYQYRFFCIGIFEDITKDSSLKFEEISKLINKINKLITDTESYRFQ